MPPFLSAEWIEALDRAAQADDRLGSATAGVELVVQQVVTDDDGDGHCDQEVAWHVDIERGRVRVRPGRAEQPDVTFTQSRRTAEEIAQGRLSAQAAFMLGSLRVGGDVSRLTEHQEAFANVEDTFATVRAGTDY